MTQKATFKHVFNFLTRNLPKIPPMLIAELSDHIVGSCDNAENVLDKLATSITDNSTIAVIETSDSIAVTIRNAKNAPVPTCGAKIFKNV